ncbi:MAG: AmmeMemoRadiSam system protein A [Clostridium sp.]
MLDYFLMPHPPVMIKEVGRGREEDIRKTIDSCTLVGEKIDSLDVDTIVIVSPHGPVFRDAISIYTTNNLSGNLGNFGAAEVKFEYETNINLCNEIIEKAGEEGIVVVGIDEKSSKDYGIKVELDHGAMVPLYYLNKNKKYKIVNITYGILAPLELMKFGRCIKNAVETLGSKAVFIASGDLSHRLVENGPYPYTPLGLKFDTELVNILSGGDFKKIFSIDKNLIKEAGECGLRSIYILAGAINSTNIESELLSYEGPLGVGYCVMEFKDNGGNLFKELMLVKEETHNKKIQNGNPYTSLARRNLESYFNNGTLISLEDINNEELLNDKKGVFVSMKINGELRGCIGTIAPTTNSVAEEIIKNSISAAINDPRFSPVREAELLEIDLSVDLLYEAEEATFEDLDPKNYGVIVSNGFKRGLLLPNLEGINTKEEQVKIAREKGGILENEDYSLMRFKVERFVEVEGDE